MSVVKTFAALSPAPGRITPTAGFAGAGEALAVAEWSQRQRRPVLFLARDAPAAMHLAEELAFFAPAITTNLLPDWECLPFDRASPPAATQCARIEALAALRRGRGITVTAATTALLPYAPADFIAARALSLRTGATVDLATLIAGLAASGYARVDRVLAAGEFAVYGGQVDVFPPAAAQPFRLVLADDKIEQIRRFDPQTQMSVSRTETAEVLPPGECDLSAAGIEHFRRAFVRRFGAVKDAVAEQVCRGQAAAGMEFMLPLFFSQSARLLEYAPADTLIIMHCECRDALARFMQQARRRQKLIGVYEHRAVLPATEVFLSPLALLAGVEKFSALELSGTAAMPPPPVVAINHRRADSHAPLLDFLRHSGGRTIIATDSEGRRNALQTVLAAAGRSAQTADTFADCRRQPLTLTVAPLRAGFVADDLTVLTEAEIFQVRLPPLRHRRTAVAAVETEELTVGGAVVHRDYGVGLYAGLAEKTVGGEAGEFLQIQYADNQRLWLPVAQLHLLSPYLGEPAALSKLGSVQWRRARARAEDNAGDTAARLLALNAQRSLGGGTAHCPDEAALASFAGGFYYEETPDQATAMAAVLADMRAQKPMDRLIVADVGFGKTEIAMRAACAAALAGVQTAVLAPTTLLAEQHARTFADRFAGFPVQVASLTRLLAAREKKQILGEIAAGTADIVIGTHALLQPSVRFHRLGLAVIDEEHRFGVRQKEHFKAMRADVDILSLSATPIPRTMAMAMEGIRDISIIATPPPARLAVHTTVAPFSRVRITDACERELLRGGQIYFVHNDIRGLPAMAEQLREWLPAARLIVAHGAMSAAEIENAMRRFVRHDADLLLCTTIVESGLDIANANTMIINRADRMGVSRLHQLRGRVGRAGAQAYALLLTPVMGAATAAGQKRLAAAADYAALGSGLFIAMRDLEVRGAGEMLGERQSGDLAAVGYAMYQKMINSAARRLAGQENPADVETVVELPLPALLPADYVPAVGERLRYYCRLSACTQAAAVDAMRLEWEDRFGTLPAAAKRLIMCHHLRLLAGAVQALKVRAGRDHTAMVEFAENPCCRRQLLQQINAGVCRPAAAGNAVVIDNIAAEPLRCGEQLVDFLRALAAAE